jgi:GTP cyclohydrolase I
MEMIVKSNENIVRTEEEKQLMIEEAAVHYGAFLTAMGFDWQKDPSMTQTPRRVAKMWVNDLIEGCITPQPNITSFPNDSKYSGLVCQTKIPISSICAHHHLPFFGFAHIAYIPGEAEDSTIIGLSKLNRIADWFSRRPNIQESLTKQIHDFVNENCKGNRGVAVVIEAQHCCVRCRGIRQDSVMKTSEMSGYFFENAIGTRQEFFSLIDQSRTK